MAKKKKRRSSSGRSAGTATATRGSSSRLADPTSVKPAPAQEGGPNRLARKEEARRERDRIRRKIARRQTLRRASRWGIAAAVVGGIAFFVFLSNRPTAATAAERTTIARGQRAAPAAGCSAIRTIGEYRDGQDRTHIQSNTGPPLSTYPSTPPTSGPHNPSPLNAGVYSDPPDIWRVIHSLEHGATVIWYAPQVERNAQLQRIKDYFGDPAHNDHVIVAPYNYANQGTAGQLPKGKPIALTAWHHLQTCAQPNFDVVQGFVVQYTADGQGTYRGNAPEAGGAI